jgi:hypothetical protein
MIKAVIIWVYRHMVIVSFIFRTPQVKTGADVTNKTKHAGRRVWKISMPRNHLQLLEDA